LNGLRKLATVIAFLLPADTVDDVASTIFMKTASQRQKLADIVALSSSPSSTPARSAPGRRCRVHRTLLIEVFLLPAEVAADE
jgi:hypothetical protein